MLLNENPFYLLSASTRDPRPRLLELAEEKSLSLEPAICTKARAELTNPRQRLHAELAWLPGMSPNAAVAAVKAALAGTPGLSFPNPTCRINATLTGLANLDLADSDALASTFVALATSCELLDAVQVQTVINEDRKVAGFPLVKCPADVEEAIAARIEEVATAIVAILRSCPQEVWLSTLTEALGAGTVGSTQAGPSLLHSVTDRMAADLQAPLEAAAQLVERVLSRAKELVGQGVPAALDTAIVSLGTCLRDWDRYAQPIQLSAMARGQTHQASREMHSRLRGFALELHNEHGLTDAAHHLTALLIEVFAEDLRLSEALGADKETLDGLLAKKESAKEMEAVLAEMTPIERAPSLRTVNGIGTALYGRRNGHTGSDTYVATLYFTILFVPIVPLRCYRVRQTGHGQWRFFGKVPFSKFEKVHLWGAVAALLLFVLFSATTDPGESSYYSGTGSYGATPSASGNYVAGGHSAPTSNYLTSVAESRHDQLGRWIDVERTRLNQVGATLQASAARLAQSETEIDGLERRLNGIASQASSDGELPSDQYSEYEAYRSRYRSAVDEYNAALVRFKDDDAQYEADLAAANDSVIRYNEEE